tara:strand:+ start:3632 stop:4375 length:744 start_codon:yes stop_codon:yes gene_type:complete
MKNYYFLCGLPRAGNTLFGSLMNQNKNVKVSAYSILPNMFTSILDFKNNLHFKTFPDHSLVDNVLHNLLNNSYASWNTDNIIDRGPWGHMGCISLIKDIIPNPKFIILYRPILEVMVSMMKIYKPTNIIEYCDHLMTDSIVSDNYFSIQNLVNQKENYLLINYDDIINSPTETIKKTCKFLNIKYIKPNINKIEQFSVNGIYYDDSFLSGKYHELKSGPISKNKTKIEDWLPQQIIDRYSSWEISFK